MRKDNYRGVTMHCVVCTNPIPVGRKWDSATCSKQCSKKRKDFGRSRRDQLECRYCLKPSTPEDRALYSAWKKAMKKGLNDEQFVANIAEITRIAQENERLKRRLAELAPAERVENE
jgi:predicted nucleic acid-binding Zn ribbon protein